MAENKMKEVAKLLGVEMGVPCTKVWKLAKN